MNSKNTAFRDTGIIAVGQVLCTAAMILVFALVGKYSLSVLLGGLLGAAVATANFFIMSFVANLAADKAASQDVAGGQKMIQLSYTGRMLGTFLVLILLAKSGHFHALALVLPLAFTRPILTIAELFKKKGENKA